MKLYYKRSKPEQKIQFGVVSTLCCCLKILQLGDLAENLSHAKTRRTQRMRKCVLTGDKTPVEVNSCKSDHYPVLAAMKQPESATPRA